MAKKEKREVRINLTSLMDVTFQLIVFFLLVTNFAAAELPPLEPPKPTVSQAQPPERERDVLIVNVVPVEAKSGEAREVRVGTLPPLLPGEYGQLTDMLREEKKVAEAAGGTLIIDLRADKSIEYAEIQPVMAAITQAEIANINLRATLDED